MAPIPNPVIPDVGEAGVVIVPAPDIKVHKPVPVVGVLAAIVATVAHTDCDGPATEIDGESSLHIRTVSRLTVQPEPDIVQIN